MKKQWKWAYWLSYVHIHTYIHPYIQIPSKSLVFHRGMSTSIYDLILYLKNEGLNISWISRYNSSLVLKNGIHNTVFYSVSSWTQLYFSKVQWIGTRSRRWIYAKTNIFVSSLSLIFKFFFKRVNHEEHP